MSLNREKLGEQIRLALLTALSEESSKKVFAAVLSDRLSKIIDSYIRSADVVDISVDVDGKLETEIDLPIEAEVTEGLTVSGRGYTQNGPIQVVAETVEKGTVVGNVKGKHETIVSMECKQNSPGKLR